MKIYMWSCIVSWNDPLPHIRVMLQTNRHKVVKKEIVHHAVMFLPVSVAQMSASHQILVVGLGSHKPAGINVAMPVPSRFQRLEEEQV